MIDILVLQIQTKETQKNGPIITLGAVEYDVVLLVIPTVVLEPKHSA